MSAMTGDYRFSAEPRTIQDPHGRYREPQLLPPSNIMYDRRVVRGNTYAAMIVPEVSRQDMERRERLERKHLQRLHQRKHEVAMEKEIKEHMEEAEQNEPQKFESDFDGEFEEQEKLVEALYENMETEPRIGNLTQSEFYIDRPPSPLFIPTEPGVEKETQIRDGDLFDFDLEVEPILEVLIGKSLEQSRMEVLEEEEIKKLKIHQTRYQQQRNAELMETQRKEAEYIRREQEAERRQLQAGTRRQQMEFAHQKFVSRIISKRFLQSVPHQVVQQLVNLGPFLDSQDTAIYEQLVPWVLQNTTNITQKKSDLKLLLSRIAEEALIQLKREHNRALQGEVDRREGVRREEIRVKKETEERKRDRQVARIKRQAQRDRLALKEKVDSEIIQRGTLVQGITTHLFGDIDGREGTPVLSTPGGILGELLNFFTCLEEHLELEELTQQQVQQLVLSYITNCMKFTSITLNVDPEAYEELTTNMETDQEGFYLLPEEQHETLHNFFLDHANGEQGTTLADMRDNPSTYRLKPSMYRKLILGLLSIIMTPDIEEGVDNPIRQKVLIQNFNRPELEVSEEAVVKVTIYQEPIPEEQEEQEQKDSQSQSKPKSTPREPEPDDKTVKIAHLSDQVGVFVVHPIAQRFLRKELVQWVRNIKGYDAVQPEVLFQLINERAQEYEEKRLAVLASDLHVFEFYTNVQALQVQEILESIKL